MSTKPTKPSKKKKRAASIFGTPCGKCPVMSGCKAVFGMPECTIRRLRQHGTGR